MWAGRGLTSKIIASEVPANSHPLGPGNKLVIAPGYVSGTKAPTSGRVSVGAKSPLTGGIKEANSGGLASHKIAHLGIKAIVLEGDPKPGQSSILQINSAGATLIPSGDLAGKPMYQVVDKLGAAGKLGVMGIGPAGEMRLAGAGVCVNDMENYAARYAGRGGVGAVMGAKGVKAIVVDDEGSSGAPIADPAAFNEGIKKLREASLQHAVTKKGGSLNTYGTAVLVNIMNEAGGFPTRNFSQGRFEKAAEISGEAIREAILQRGGVAGHPCHPGCIIQCSNRWARSDGTVQPAVMEYESVWSLGANCGIGDLDDIGDLIWLCNDIGVDTIEMGCTIAVAMEGGVIPFGDAAGAKNLLEEVRKGTPLGRIIGSGAATTGLTYGVRRVPVVKGQAMPAYEPRAVKGIGIVYATSTMGADHTSGYTIAPEILGVSGKLNPFDVQKADLARAFLNTTAFLDSTGYCLFYAFAVLDIASGFEGMVQSAAAVSGQTWTPEYAVGTLGAEIVRLERQFNVAAGMSRGQDRIPEFMETETLPPHNVNWGVPAEVLDAVHKD
jgi:aldehyde:ferredoxin oxidoreductase